MEGHSITREGLIARGYPPDRFWTGPIYCGHLYPLCKKLSANELNDTVSEREAGYRILFVGTSQTVGAGAHELGETLFVQAYRKLSAVLDQSASVEMLNMAISGSTSGELLQEYRRYYLDFSPDLVVITFENGVSGFLKSNQSKGIKTVFVEEATCAESGFDSNLLENHQILRAPAKEHDIPIFSLHHFLSQRDILESGTIWQDPVHLTSYGQTLTAAWLVARLLKTLSGNGAAYQRPSSDHHSIRIGSGSMLASTLLKVAENARQVVT